MGPGKGWAKGLKATTDSRIARAAAGHLGKTYVRRVDPALDRRSKFRRPLPVVWDASLAYVVGLMATDGCLSRDGRHLTFTNTEIQLIDVFLRLSGHPARPGVVDSGFGTWAWRVQFSDVALYRFLLEVGLTPAKSLTLGPIAVPDEFLAPLTRGLMDGDGSVISFTYSGTGKAKGRNYDAIRVYFLSASLSHIEWLSARLLDAYGVRGSISWVERVYRLQYAMRASLQLLPKLYRDSDGACLERKRQVWLRFLRDQGLE